MRQFGMFAKYWQPGSVKTRLAATIGDLAASRLYREFVQCLVERFQQIGDCRILAFAPPDARAEFHALVPASWELQPQCAGDLGTRMQHYFGQALEAGRRQVLLIGSDSPTLPKVVVRQAFEALDQHQAVLGPTADGGYYLVGISGTVPPIFEGIDWSTDSVWQQTVDRLRAAGVTYAELPEWYDVDQAADLQTLRAELATPRCADIAPLACLGRQLDKLVPAPKADRPPGET